MDLSPPHTNYNPNLWRLQDIYYQLGGIYPKKPYYFASTKKSLLSLCKICYPNSNEDLTHLLALN